MGRRKVLTKEERIKREEKRLLGIYKDLDSKKKEVVQGLIQRAAHLRITLEDFAKDLDENGYTELFSQGNQEPYERKRPTADLYNTMNTNYQKIIKQLTDLLPKEQSTLLNEKSDGDDFDDFLQEKDR